MSYIDFCFILLSVIWSVSISFRQNLAVYIAWASLQLEIHLPLSSESLCYKYVPPISSLSLLALFFSVFETESYSIAQAAVKLGAIILPQFPKY